MENNQLTIPSHKICKTHLLKALNSYWVSQSKPIESLPIYEAKNVSIRLPLNLVPITLPDWGKDYGVNGIILLPGDICEFSPEIEWDKVDWWMGAFMFLEGWHEREYEKIHGPIHSYSNRLKGWDTRVWDYAWVNRIAMFLRAWAANIAKVPEEKLLGELPTTELIMTHDVDAISKTLSIRLKQSAFNWYNVYKALKRNDWQTMLYHVKQAWYFLLSQNNYWLLNEMFDIEQEAGIKSHYNFYADLRHKTIKRWLFDPGYKISNERVLRFIDKVYDRGYIIGLHPSYDAWEVTSLLKKQINYLSETTRKTINSCRQHWLRFGWNKTWISQEKSGILLDTTLMFNDRPGFRCAASLIWHPWNTNITSEHTLTCLPTIIMDSHLYDYNSMNDAQRILQMQRWINEVKFVHGKAAVLWHPHTLAKDYGWKKGFLEMIKLF